MWSFEVFDEKFTEDQLTLDDYIALEDTIGVGWRLIHPLNSAKQARHIAALMYSQRLQMPLADALVKVGQLGAVEFADHLEVLAIEAEDDEPADPPKAGES